MKKILVVLGAMVLLANTAQAKDVSRVVVEDTTLKEVDDAIMRVIDSYSGVITPIKLDKESHMYVVNYNAGTLLDVVGVGGKKDWAADKYAKASFSCSAKALNDDVLLTCRKSKKGSVWTSSYTFDHYKKVYNELQYDGKVVRKYKRN